MHLRTLFVVTTAGLALAACASKPKVAAPGAPLTPPPAADANPQPGAAPIDQAALTAQQDLAAKAGDRVYFALDSHDLDAAARATLERQVAWLMNNPNARARLEGNADERGTREYNLALGARRANAVRQFLISRGVSPSRLETLSYGKERPIDPGSGEEAWSRNRNAHTAVVGAPQR